MMIIINFLRNRKIRRFLLKENRAEKLLRVMESVKIESGLS